MGTFALFENDEQEGFEVTPEMIAATAYLNAERRKTEAHEKAYYEAQEEKQHAGFHTCKNCPDE